MSDERLEYLARHAGLSVDWIDANGQPQRVRPQVLRQVLAGLGHPADSLDEIEKSLRSLEEVGKSVSLPPLLTVDLGRQLKLGRWFAAHSHCQVLLEDGSQHETQLDEHAALSHAIPIGYHQITIERQAFTVAVAPARCYSMADALDSEAPRAWGLSAQLYSLRREGDGGFGDTQALELLARSAAERGVDALAISPMHAMFSSDAHRYSPYSPSSRLFFNSLYAAPGEILGERAVRLAIEQAGLDAELQRLEQLPLIDWPAATTAKQTLLRQLFNDFNRGDNPLTSDFDSFRQAGGEALENHCRFEALQAECAAKGSAQDWRQWHSDWHDPRSEAIAEFSRTHADEVRYYAFCQWLVARSLERAQQAARAGGMRIGLIADLAVGADGAGSQAWSRQDELLSELTVGAPPDILNRAGQSWGISAFAPEGLQRHGYRAFIEMLRANFAHAGGLRIDHVMGLQRLWVIPRGNSPRDGAYLNYPLDDLLRLLALESVRHQAIVLGEDLGTVPDGLREKLAARAILGIRVLLFEQYHTGYFKPILQWPDNALATSTTHDLSTLNGWWRSRDIDWYRDLKLIDAPGEQHWRETRQHERQGLRNVLAQDSHNFKDNAEETDQVIDASIRFLGHTRAPLVLIPLEDLLGIEEQPNLPGTTAGHPNWCRRFALPSVDLLDDEDAARRLELLAQARDQAGERDR
ncbi:4-alpha-glucanotransferase [Pseudomonas sp. R5(2019)]|uniref:4-alpha-glucanotransferase n=1 Tax=Pseudomonas sp. R5(2019) TaxID=2697566 RepID=UPI001412E071|nr:4-alpha-glucanotransferase [Pseudomonas sp. R5(2019)]NBA93376.1 4-alpha-glucanotransferase [Pseudomonas sp. R5(2019)]